MGFSSDIIKWYKANKRDLPWRKTQDPYKIWLSEIILQQTRVEQGLKYYFAFISSFPNISELADASTDKVMKLWQGLGYYSRARNLHQTAKQIVQQYNGIFPENIEDIKKLKGIGDYTAAAIASFSFNKPYAVVDGNVIRLITRVFGITQAVEKIATKKNIQQKVTELLPKKTPAIFNQAIMEFGAMQCIPRNPDCEKCCLKSSCYAYNNNLVSKLPLKIKKTKVKNRYLNYLIISYVKDNKAFVYIKKRTEKDIWKNLYDFPCIETKKQLEPKELLLTKEWSSFFKKNKPAIPGISEYIKHQLSHQALYVRFYEVLIKSSFNNLLNNWKLISRNDITKYAVPRVIDKYLNK